MNRLTIIGNVVKNPELRTTTEGTSVCGFTVAVNRRFHRDGEPEADFFNVSAWREKGENCAKYLQKGSKVCVIGAVSVRTYTGNDGTVRAVMEIKSADEVEFISRPQTSEQPQEQPNVDEKSGFEVIEPQDDLPF